MLRIALRLRKKTMMTLGWIAQRLRTRTKTYLAHILSCHDTDKNQQREASIASEQGSGPRVLDMTIPPLTRYVQRCAGRELNRMKRELVALGERDDE